MKSWIQNTLLIATLMVLGCGSELTPALFDTAQPADTTPEVQDTTPPKPQCDQGANSCYFVQVVTPSGLVQEFVQNLDDRPWVIAYGSSHIAPAVSLAIEDTWTQPYTIITFNFGFVVGSNDYAVTISEEGVWKWGSDAINAPPGFKIYLKDDGKPRTLVSWKKGASGNFLVTRWGTSPGDIIEAQIEGTLVDEIDGPDGKAVTASISGKIRLILPELGQ
jgi:hypothetical protein